MRRTLAHLALFAVLATGCGTETPTTAVAANDYPLVADGGSSAELTVYELWYQTTLFRDPLAPGAESTAERTVPTTDFAYAVLAVGWDPSSSSHPTRFVAIKSKEQLAVARGDTLRIEVSDRTFQGRCSAGSTLSEDDAELITQRIFPGAFSGITYDPKTCTATSPFESTVMDAGAPTSPRDAGFRDAGTRPSTDARAE